MNPLDLDYAERWHADVAYQSYFGGNKVGSAYEIPHNALPYPPLSYLITGGIAKLVGTNLLGVRTIGRATTLMMTLLSSMMIVLISRAIAIRLLWSVVAGLLFLICRSAHSFAVSLRPDEIALALTLLGLYAVLRVRNYWLAGGLFALALATKQSFISVPLVLTVTLLIWRDRHSVMKLLTSACLVGLLIILLGNWVIGFYWWQGFLLQSFHSADFKQAFYYIGEGFRQPVLVIGLASVLLKGQRTSLSMITACFVVSLALNSVALVKVGAAGNYLLEPIALASILSGYVAQRMLDERFGSKGFAWALILGLMIPPTVEQMTATIHSLKAQGDTSVNPKPLIELLRHVDEPILADQAWLYFDSGHKPFVCPPDLIRVAVEAGQINGSPMQQFIERRGFKAIAISPNWKEQHTFPQSWSAAIEENYEDAGLISNYKVMKPKGKA